MGKVYEELTRGLDKESNRIRLQVRNAMLRHAYEQWLIGYGLMDEVEDYCLTYAKEVVVQNGMIVGFQDARFKHGK